MAADWVRMRTNLYHDPKVSVMADAILGPPSDDNPDGVTLRNALRNDAQRRVTRNAVCGALISVWGNARHMGKRNGSDLELPFATLMTVDETADIPGFGAAMQAVGWVRVVKNGLVFPRFFDEFNADPGAGSVSKAAERQRRYRERKAVTRYVTGDAQRNVTGDVTGDVTSRQSRVEESINTPLPPEGGEGGYTAKPADESQIDPGRPTEPHPRSPLGFADAPDPLRAEEADRKRFEAAWAAAGLKPLPKGRLPASLHGLLRAAMVDAEWAEYWEPALKAAGADPFYRNGQGRHSGPLDPRDFLNDRDLARRLATRHATAKPPPPRKLFDINDPIHSVNYGPPPLLKKKLEEEEQSRKLKESANGAAHGPR